MTTPRPLPTTIPAYLDQLRQALAGSDPALIQDALYDAEEYLRAELASQKDRSEAEVIASVAGSYGAPEEVAEIYRDTEVKVQTALQPPRRPRPRSAAARFFGVAAEPRTYGALFYMLLAAATGTFYSTWVSVGLSLSLGLMVLIIGIPVAVLFFASIRALALVEGRLVETMLGERMPRRPLYVAREVPLLERIRAMFVDIRTWGTLLYMVLMLPLGTAYFAIVAVLLTASIGFVAAPIVALVMLLGGWSPEGLVITPTGPWVLPLIFLAGVLLLFATMHIARGLGYVHAQIAKHLLVHSPARAVV